MATVPCLYAPVTAATSGMVFRLERNPNGAPGNTTTNTTITAGTYSFPTSTGSLAARLVLDFGTVDGVSVSATASIATGIVSIIVSGLEAATNAVIHWNNSTATQALGTALGFDVSAADTVAVSGGAATFVSDYALPGYWTPSVPVVSDESVMEQDVVVTRTHGGQNAYDRLSQFIGRRLGFGFVPAARTNVIDETTTNQSIERILRHATYPAKFRWFEDRATLSSGYDDYFLDPAALTQWSPSRLNAVLAYYSFDLTLWEHTA